MLSLLLALASKASGQGPLANFSESRFQQAKPYFEQVTKNPVERALLAGLAWTESDFIPSAIGPEIPGIPERAHGMMQIMEFHFPRFGWQGTEWAEPAKNVMAGYTILKDSGLGVEPITQVLANYGGFVNNDPTDYVNKVLTRSAYLLPRFF